MQELMQVKARQCGRREACGEMKFDFDDRPFIVIWEVTRACSLACRHCRAEANLSRHPLELNTEEAFRFIEQVERCRPTLFVMTGGDPIRRLNLESLIRHATNRGLRVSLSPSATPEFAAANLDEFKDAGVERISPYDIKTTEGQHYRRVVLQQSRGTKPSNARAPLGINDGKGFVFVSHIGNIQPSGFLPLSAGNVRKDELLEVYRNSPLFRELRNPSLLKGKCGRCEFKTICGGSRARSYAMTGDYLGEERVLATSTPRATSTPTSSGKTSPWATSSNVPSAKSGATRATKRSRRCGIAMGSSKANALVAGS